MTRSDAVASMHVLRAPIAGGAAVAWRAMRWLRSADDVRFFVGGRTSAGMGRRDISRSLSPRRVAMVVAWSHAGAAAAGRRAFDTASRRGGTEVWSALLAPIHARGTWGGAQPFRPEPGASSDGVVASLTCARVRPRRVVSFYVQGFPKTARHARDPGSGMLAGLGFGGAVPLRDACTISLWPSQQAVTGFAYRDAPHDPVRRSSIEESWLSQSLFARFVVVDHGGSWAGGDPLAQD